MTEQQTLSLSGENNGLEDALASDSTGNFIFESGNIIISVAKSQAISL